jgi:arabinosaccharide transport system substrate-binding protein
MKRFLAILLTALMLMSFATITASAAEPTKITFWTFQELHVSFYEEMAKEWNEKYPDRQIELVPSALPYDDMHNKLTIALQSGVGAPDLVDIEIGKFANYLKGTPQLVPINRVVEPELDNIVRSRVDIYSKDGNFYGICFHIGAAVIYYNDKLLKEAGIDYTQIKTWDQYHEAGKKFLAATGKPMGTVEIGDVWHLWPMIASQGGDLLDKDGNPNIASPEMEKALAYNQELLKEGVLAIAPGTGHHSEEYYGLMDSESFGSVIMPMWYMNRFTDYMPDLKKEIAIAPLPVWEEGQPRSVGLGGTGTCVTNQAKDPELTMDFLAFAKLSKEGNIQIWKLLGFDPIRSEVWSLPEVRDDVNKFTEYYINNPFDVLLQIKDEIPAVHVAEALPPTMDALKNSVLFRAYEDMADLKTMLPEENAKVIVG